MFHFSAQLLWVATLGLVTYICKSGYNSNLLTVDNFSILCVAVPTDAVIMTTVCHMNAV